MLKSLVLGPVGLYARVLLVALAGWLANQGLAIYDAEAGTLLIHVEQMAAFVASMVAAGVYAAWRLFAKARGGKL